MKTAIVVDRLDSGLGISALSRASIDSEIIVFPALDFKTPGALISELVASNSSSVLFSWRFLLLELLNSKTCAPKIQLLREKSCIGFLIPDHLGGQPEYFKKEEWLSERADFFLVTSEILAHFYSKSKISNKFAGIFHDLPDLQALGEVMSLNLPKQDTVIWVGNPKWGHRQGFVDHKGYFQTIVPLSQLLSNSNHVLRMKLIDSSHTLMQNKDVLVEIAKARFLVVASASEGTCLPILEALGLRTIPISTRVGVAPEVLKNQLEKFLVEPSVIQMMGILEKYSGGDLSHELDSSFESYVLNAKLEKIPKVKSPDKRNLVEVNSRLREVVFLARWVIRYSKKLLLKIISK